MSFPLFNLFVRYDALLRGWCVAYVGGASMHISLCTCVFVRGKNEYLKII
jgi:hypothetical protein